MNSPLSADLKRIKCLGRHARGAVLIRFSGDRVHHAAHKIGATCRHPLEAITADGLRSYGAAMGEPGNRAKQEVGRWANNRVENAGKTKS